MNMKLFEPVEFAFLGSLKNRVVMAAMTRGFADPNHCATDAMKNYYAQRAKFGVGLILTEGVVIDVSGDGYKNVPHMANLTQAESWKPIIEAVHSHGTKIVCQLWHCGRISHQDFTGGLAPVSSTSIAAEGMNRQNGKPFAVPVPLTKDGIQKVQNDYIKSAALALDAGFDAVQFHFAHGYLIDQFFDARINTMTNEYGGSIENRARFAIEIVEKAIQRFGPRKVCVRISPSRDMGSIYDWPDLEALLTHTLKEFSRVGLRILDISCARADYYATSGRVIKMARADWKWELMGGASLTPEQAEKEIKDGHLDLVTWGRFILANPDFVRRIQNQIELDPFSPEILGQLK